MKASVIDPGPGRPARASTDVLAAQYTARGGAALCTGREPRNSL
jgi:hypothetical protein